MRVAVLYIWVPGTPFEAHTEKFVESYHAHPAGAEHDLVLVCKADTLPREWPNLPATQCLAVGEGGYDVGPLLELAARFDRYDRIVLLGAYSRILADGWLGKLCAGGELCSATGSYEIRPHLRTNCLSVTPGLLARMSPCSSKQDCWDFEHSEHSIFEVARSLGIHGMVVGSDGAYPQADWPLARTYRTGEQENLICADNHTDRYANASAPQRSKLEREAWGARAGSGRRAPITVLTVTIPGRGQSLSETIESVYAQTVPVERQLLCAHRAAPSLPQVQYSAAKNALLQAVDSQWVAVLNDDDTWLPEHVETVLSETERGDVIYSWDQAGSRPRENCNDWTRKRLGTYFDRGNFLDGNCLIRTEALRAVGGFPINWTGSNGSGHYDGSPATFEDWELWRRMMKAGARFRCVPEETWRYGTQAAGRLSR